MISVISVATAIALEKRLAFAIAGMSATASRTLLRGLIGGYFKPGFAGPVCFIL
jgi:hypothetical protein